MHRPTIHLICNAHLDPVWQWPWEEGAAEAVSTFRVAADFCERFDAFIFNHNEVVLYQWVEQYEPALFRRIQKLVKAGKWHIMGGWYLQPDCNMPSGEAIVRQILVGRKYFSEKFGVTPTTALNFDSFGHSRGLVQIMARSGYDSYIYCRPPMDRCAIPADNYTWVGFDGSTITNCRAQDMYVTGEGQAAAKVGWLLPRFKDRPCAYVLWGIGNHGGGPSLKDLRMLNKTIRAKAGEFDIVHSTPEAYFKQLHHEVKRGRMRLPKVDYDLNPIMVGCYTSMAQIKQTYRRIENELLITEKMAATAASQGLIDYPDDELSAAQRDMLFAQFHDILPGSSVQPVEQSSLRLMNHGLEILSRVRARAFFALASGQKKIQPSRLPILVYNPHPHPVQTIVECEVQPADSGWDQPQRFRTVIVRDANGKQLSAQTEKEQPSIACDWRKRPVFVATLKPGQMNRFDCELVNLPRKPAPKLKARNGEIRFKNGDGLDVILNARTGFVDRLRVKGTDYLAANAFRPLVMHDNEDPWGMGVTSFRKVAGAFKLMSGGRGTAFSGLPDATLPSVRVIEDGPVRSVIEVVLAYGDSAICQHYKLPKAGTEIEVSVRVFWNEKNRMLKLSVPATPKLAADAVLHGQVMYGNQALPSDGNEAIAQKWTAIVSAGQRAAITCINDGTYGCDLKDGEMRLSLLRSAAYCAHPIGNRQILPQDRFLPRIDQGERVYRFWLNFGPATTRLRDVDVEAQFHNEPPFALSFCPSGAGKLPKAGPELDDSVIELVAFKRAQAGGDWIVRLFNPTSRSRTTLLAIPCLGLRPRKLSLGKFEIKTLRINPRRKTAVETDLVEKPL